MKKKPLIILTGPTAVGKTALSLALAKQCRAEIISADSMQVYRTMDIGTAKLPLGEREGILHHLIDILNPDEPFSIAMFQAYAKKAMEKIYAAGHIPMIVGGTGFYIQSVLYDIDFTETEVDEEKRREWEELYEREGALAFHERLKKVDAKAAGEIHPNNKKRVIRALEFYEQTGRPISEHNEVEHQKSSPYCFAYFVLNEDRSKLYEKINVRIDQMLEAGLLQEVRQIYEHHYDRELPSMKGLGYKEFFPYFDGTEELTSCVERLKRETRHFAKRQLTWFRREREVIWISKEEFQQDESKMLEYMMMQLEKKGIIHEPGMEGTI